MVLGDALLLQVGGAWVKAAMCEGERKEVREG